MRIIAAFLTLCALSLWGQDSGQSTGVFGAFAASKEWTPPKDPAVLKKLEAWQDQKVGLLIHWGTYSQYGIVESWSLVTTRHPWNNRPQQFAHLSDQAYVREYESWQRTFNPTNFNPGRWAAAASDAGVKYMIITTKHHDGFCMWNTATTDYRITSPASPFHQDPRADTIREACMAFRKAGLSTGLYFSKADWYNTNYWLPELPPGSGQGPNYNPRQQPERWKQFKDYTWRQVEELMSAYGPQDVLWLDGGAVRPPNAGIDMDGLAALARRHQPGLIVVDRTVRGVNENYVTPEGEIPEHYLPYPWETCMTMGSAWTYKPNDQFKSTGTLIRNLCRIVARNGNYLIGIGPDGTGEFDPTVYTRLKELGQWLRLNGEALYGTRPIQPYEQGDCVFTTRRDGMTYAILLSRDDSAGLPEKVTLPPQLLTRTASVHLLGHGPLKVGSNGEVQFTDSIRAKPPCRHAWTLKLTPKE